MPTPRRPPHRIAVLDDYQQVASTHADWDSLAAQEVTFFASHLGGADGVVAALEPYDVVVAMRERTAFPREVLERLPHLRLLVTTGPANVAIDVAAARERGVTVSGTGGVSPSTPTVELTWALILAVARHVPAEDRAVREGGWQHTVGHDLAGRRLGVIGLGGLGKPVATVGLAFGMDVVAWSQHLDPDDARAAGVTPVGKDELLATSDVVTLHVKLSARTTGLVGRDDLSRMKPTALLVNTSRGPIVDEDALVEALHAGTIGGAGLDVFGTEPLPVDSPLRTLPNTVLTPHLGYVTEGSYDVFYRDAVEDIAAWADGAPIRELGPGDGG
ncbi:D-2-hydroxyacid dehydrogenase family protein [Actinomycetospora cinnamomea]|uniref:Lactate dehydrogenase-like 2-hydroxyacid dehydrogenase n=1 Tax=Actinomycetospora cinnamomea TaxID=663609 RepID=A0A2U1FLI9_9PSEU|nr:D-2-hydroxyacid dehydrogenase family protein [Actinomycetospora cinnamomea]PVZ13073.1 lactate dehydrogenase-like 2-hydroxyacid dehydrogenase [Actinomycetospora cinnamomea]